MAAVDKDNRGKLHDGTMLLPDRCQFLVLAPRGGAITLPTSSLHEPATALYGQVLQRQSHGRLPPTKFHTHLLVHQALYVLRGSCVLACVVAKSSRCLAWRLKCGCCGCFNLVDSSSVAGLSHQCRNVVMH